MAAVDKYGQIWYCDNLSCTDTRKETVKCKCKTVAYCSAKCQLKHWPRHKLNCDKVTELEAKWVERIRTHLHMMRKNEACRYNIWEDVYNQYKKIGKRGVVISDITVDIKPEIDNSSNNNDESKIMFKNPMANVWNYFPNDDDMFKVDKYKYVLDLTKKYNPENQFILMVFCSDEPSGKTCHMTEIFGITPQAIN